MQALIKTPAKVLLAPMEGVIDYPMRQLLCEIGGYDRCVTEFIRVTNVLLPERVFLRYCPELDHGCHTLSGVPVHIQLLGSDEKALAMNAVRAVNMGAPGIDLNFGCPAKTVNRSHGGSILLKEPRRVAAIVAKVREAVPAHIPVSVKIRLGYDSSLFVEDIARGIQEAGADELCIHARTKTDGYKPPAHWQLVRAVSRNLDIPVVINGEIWSPHDATNARNISACRDLMLGRGALSRPDLALSIKHQSSGLGHKSLGWESIVVEVEKQFERSNKEQTRHIGNRTKQWLAYLRREYRGAATLFSSIKPLHCEADIRSAITTHRKSLHRKSSELQSEDSAMYQKFGLIA